jgi:hypothetical protein
MYKVRHLCGGVHGCVPISCSVRDRMRCTVRGVVLTCLLFGTLITSAMLKAQSSAKSIAITPNWVASTFLSAVDDRDIAPEIWSTVWPVVRSRPEMVDALLLVYRTHSFPALMRRNALMMMGATGQARGYSLLVQLFDRSRVGDEERLNMIIGFGNGPQEPPDYVYARLATVLGGSHISERRGAAFSLGSIRTARAQQILRSRQTIERSPSVLQMINRRLAAMKR